MSRTLVTLGSLVVLRDQTFGFRAMSEVGRLSSRGAEHTARVGVCDGGYAVHRLATQLGHGCADCSHDARFVDAASALPSVRLTDACLGAGTSITSPSARGHRTFTGTVACAV